MTETTVAFEGFRLGVAAVAIVYVWTGPLRSSQLDAWRQDLFAVRNRLWDRMSELGALDAPEHHQVRKTIDSMIKHAHTVTLLRFAALTLFCPARPGGRAAAFSEVDRVADCAVKAALVEAINALSTLVVWQLFLNTMPGQVFGWPVKAVAYLLEAASWVGPIRLRFRSFGRRFAGHYDEADPAPGGGRPANRQLARV